MKRMVLTAGAVLALVAALACAQSGRSIVRFGRDVVIGEGERVRSAVAVGADVTVEGTVTEDAVAVGGSLTVGPNGNVGNNAVAVGGEVRLSSGSVVSGELVEIDAPAVSSVARSAGITDWGAVFWVSRLVSLLGMLALALLIVAVFPRQIEVVSSVAESRFLASLLWGIGGSLLIVPVAILLAVSIVGILLIPLEIILVVAGFFFGYIAIARVVGKRIAGIGARGGGRIYRDTLIGIAVLWLAGLVPLVGPLIRGLAAVVGFGGVIAALTGTGRRPSETTTG